MKKLLLLIKLIRFILEILDDGKVTKTEWDELTSLVKPYLSEK